MECLQNVHSLLSKQIYALIASVDVRKIWWQCVDSRVFYSFIFPLPFLFGYSGYITGFPRSLVTSMKQYSLSLLYMWRATVSLFIMVEDMSSWKKSCFILFFDQEDMFSQGFQENLVCHSLRFYDNLVRE